MSARQERYYLNREPGDQPRKTRFSEFSEGHPWNVNLPSGTYLYVILPKTLFHKESLRVAMTPLEMVVPSALSHIDIAVRKNPIGQEYVSAVLAAGIVHMSDETIDGTETRLISEVDQNTGHFKTGNNNPQWQEQASKIAGEVFAKYGAPITPSTRFTTYRDRGN